MAERWFPIEGHPGYSVSSMGRVASPRKVLKAYPNSKGYLSVALPRTGRPQRTVMVHRLVAIAVHGEPAPGQEVRHLNGVQTDNRAENLRWGTAAENNADTIAHGHHQSVNRTECPSGHPYDEDNTRTYKGHRRCRACDRVRSGQIKPCPRCGRERSRSVVGRHMAQAECPTGPGSDRV